MVFYAAIILLLVGTNLHRFRKRSGDSARQKNQTKAPQERLGMRDRKPGQNQAPDEDGEELDDGTLVVGTTDYIIDMDASSDRSVILPLLSSDCVEVQQDYVELHTSDVHDDEAVTVEYDEENDDAGSCIEAIEVSYTADNKPKYTHSYINRNSINNQDYEHDQDEDSESSHLGSFPRRIKTRKETHSTSSLSLSTENHSEVNSSRCQKNKPYTSKKLSSSGKALQMVSTTVVSNLDSESSVRKKHEVRVGFTAEEEIRPRGLLEMTGDDAVDPVPI